MTNKVAFPFKAHKTFMALMSEYEMSVGVFCAYMYYYLQITKTIYIYTRKANMGSYISFMQVCKRTKTALYACSLLEI